MNKSPHPGARDLPCRPADWPGWHWSPPRTRPYGLLVPGFVMAGAGMALVFAPAANAVLSSDNEHRRPARPPAPPTRSARSAACSACVLATVFSRRRDGLAPGLRGWPGPAVWVGAAVLAVGALAALLIPRRTASAQPAVRTEPASGGGWRARPRAPRVTVQACPKPRPSTSLDVRDRFPALASALPTSTAPADRRSPGGGQAMSAYLYDSNANLGGRFRPRRRPTS